MKRPLKDPSLLRPPPEGFECGETFEEGEVGSVTFYAALPPPTPAENRSPRRRPERLVFGCRGRSINVLRGNEDAVNDDDLEEANECVDPNFFDAGYGLAGRTGFQVWAGSRLMLECLLAWPTTTTGRAGGADADNEADLNSSNSETEVANASRETTTIELWRRQIAEGAKVLELGSGVGVVGASLAAAGAQVLLTDLPTLVDNATRTNLLLNENNNEDSSDDDEAIANVDDASTNIKDECPGWLESSGAVAIGRGWAGATALDWTKSVDEQLSRELCEGVDLIVASDCVWLVAMLDALFDTVTSIFEASSCPSSGAAEGSDRPQPCTFLMSFQRRDAADGSESASFTTVERVVEAAEGRGWNIECIAWRPVGDGGGEDAEKEIFLFRIRNLLNAGETSVLK